MSNPMPREGAGRVTSDIQATAQAEDAAVKEALKQDVETASHVFDDPIYTMTHWLAHIQIGDIPYYPFYTATSPVPSGNDMLASIPCTDSVAPEIGALLAAANALKADLAKINLPSEGAGDGGGGTLTPAQKATGFWGSITTTVTQINTLAFTGEWIDRDLAAQDNALADIGQGLATGGKALINGTGKTIVATATLGLVEGGNLLTVTPADMASGYATSETLAKIGTQILVGVATGGAACTLANGGRAAQVASHALRAFDVAGNVVSGGQAAIDILHNKPNFTNVMQLIGAGLGAAGAIASPCFVGDTQIVHHIDWVEPPLADSADMFITALPPEHVSSGWLCIAACGTVGSYILKQREDERRRRAALDRCFAEWQADAEDDECDPAADADDQPEKASHEMRGTLAVELSDGEPHNPNQENTMPAAPQRNMGLISRPWASRLRGALWLLPLVLAGFCIQQAVPARFRPSLPESQASTSAGATVATPLQRSSSELRTAASDRKLRATLATLRIDEIQPGMRVLAQNPELAGQDVPQAQFDPATTRLVRMRLPKPDGGHVDIETLRTTDQLLGWLWERLKSQTGQVPLPRPVVGSPLDLTLVEGLLGHTCELELSELRIQGQAVITSIQPCPDLESDDGTGRRLVTSTFRHSAGNVLDLSIGGEAAPIGTTANHPFWSEDRQTFVPAGQLREGEWLRRADQTLTQVTRITPRTGPPEVVHNLEIDGQHVYHVGQHGALVHNGCSSPQKLVRYGSPDTAAKLAADAAAAEAKFGHGVSVILRKPPNFPHGQADFEEAEKIFQIIKTGDNKSHYTVILPKPVTQAIADLFNSVFKSTGG